MHIKHIPFCPHLVPLMYLSFLWPRYPQSHLWKEWLLVCNSRMCTSFLPGIPTEWLKTKRYLIRETRGQIRRYCKNYLKKWCINCCQSLSFPCPWYSLAAILSRTTLIGQSYSTYLWRMIYGRKSSRPKIHMSPETRVMSPKIFSQVARKFYHAWQHPNTFIALIPCHKIFKNKIYYSLDVLISFHQG